MNEKLRAHVEKLFENAPKTNRVTELKEELLTNLNEKYNDLLAANYREEDAYNLVIGGIGDVEELIRGVNSNPLDPALVQKSQKRSALAVSFSVFLYILSLIAVIVLEPVGDEIAIVTFLGIVGLSTCLLIYHFMSRPKYVKYDNTIVEEFKEWKSGKTSRNKLRNSIVSLVWTLTVVIYFLISFIFMNWHISWIIFLIAVVVTQIIKLIFDYKD